MSKSLTEIKTFLKRSFSGETITQMYYAKRNILTEEMKYVAEIENEDPEGYKIWRLEQMINFGLDGEKLDRNLIKMYWDKLSIDPAARSYLDFLLWPKKIIS